MSANGNVLVPFGISFLCICVRVFYSFGFIFYFFIFDICIQEQTKHITDKMAILSEWKKKKINGKHRKENCTEIKWLLQKSSFQVKIITFDITCLTHNYVAHQRISSIVFFFTYFRYKYSVVQTHKICGHNLINMNGNQFKIKHHYILLFICITFTLKTLKFLDKTWWHELCILMYVLIKSFSIAYHPKSVFR